MAIDFMKSRTRENLMRAFAGESQARNRYTIAAKTAKEQGMYAVSQIFLFTADQERAHAERYYQLLKKSSGSTIAVDGAYPVDHSDNVTKLLEAAKRFPVYYCAEVDTKSPNRKKRTIHTMYCSMRWRETGRRRKRGFCWRSRTTGTGGGKRRRLWTVCTGYCAGMFILR